MENIFSKRLKELRSGMELSQAKLSKILSIPRQTYDNWEQGHSQPNFDRLIQLSLFFDVSVDYLIGNSNDMYGHNTNKKTDTI